jgi:predicted Zn-dependent peptidase
MLDLVMAEFSALKETPLSEEELHRAKEQVKGNILLGLESSGSRMSNLARQEMYFQHFFSVEEVLERLDAVTSAQVQAMAQALFVSDRIAVTLLGRLDGLKLNRSRLVC